MKRFEIFVAVCMAVCLMPVHALNARLLPDWPYSKLFRQSDVAVIAKPLKTVPTWVESPKHSWPQDMVGQETTFEVIHTLKGREVPDRLKLLHFKFGELKKGIKPDGPETFIINGPLLVAFPIGDDAEKVERETGRKPHQGEFMLFLKRQGDGRYVPVSGQIDPALSVRELSEP